MERSSATFSRRAQVPNGYFADLDLHLLAKPKGCSATRISHSFWGGELPGIQFQGSLSPSDFALSQSFEELKEALESLDRSYFELDGSFLWAGETSEGPWRIDGMVYDDGQQVLWCEIKGQVPLEEWRRLLGIVGSRDEMVAMVLPERLFFEANQLSPLWTNS